MKRAKQCRCLLPAAHDYLNVGDPQGVTVELIGILSVSNGDEEDPVTGGDGAAGENLRIVTCPVASDKHNQSPMERTSDSGRAERVQPLFGASSVRKRQSTYWSGVTTKSSGSLTPVEWIGQ